VDSKRTRAVTAVMLAVVVGSSGSACGLFRSADPKDVDAIADKYTSASTENPLAVPLSTDEARCRATVILESDLSESALEAYKQSGTLTAPEKDDAKVLQELADKIAKDCSLS
jgi:hypothetical protein